MNKKKSNFFSSNSFNLGVEITIFPQEGINSPPTADRVKVMGVGFDFYIEMRLWRLPKKSVNPTPVRPQYYPLLYGEGDFSR